MSDREAAATAPTNPVTVGKGLGITGALLAVLGAVLLGVSAHMNKLAETKDFVDSLYGFTGDNHAAANTMSHWGLGLLIFGVLLGLCGLMVVLLRTPTPTPAPASEVKGR